MSDLYSEIEDGLLAGLQSLPEMATVRVWATEPKECLFTGNALSKGFTPGELPAIVVLANQEPSRSQMESVTRIGLSVPLSVVVVARHQVKREARAQAHVLALAAELLLNRWRSNGNGLGFNTFVRGEITNEVVVIQESPHHFAICEVKATVWRVIDL